jgi:predicted Zn-dependent protease
VPETALSSGIRCLQQGDADGAIDYLRRAAADNPDDPAPRLALARAYWLQGSIDPAVSAAQQVLSTHPQSVVALMIVLASELKRGRALRARDVQAKVDSIDPGYTLHADLARVLGLPVGR